MCLRAREGNSGTLSATVCEMESSKGRHAAMHNDKTREPLVLSRREGTIRPKGVVTRHESRSRDDQVCDGNRKTRPERRRGAQSAAVKEELD